MKANTKTTTKAAPAKRTDRRVPFEEMRRLMSVYGSIKCLRKRQSSSGGVDTMKVDSVKRKFYRWFPDLDERFERSDDGIYSPKVGHDAEVRYREEMRAKDGEMITRKRVSCRRQRSAGAAESTASEPERVQSSASVARISPVTVPSPNKAAEEELEIDDSNLERTSSAVIVEDTEPLDFSFIAEEGIFDDVEQSFFGQTVDYCPSSIDINALSCGLSSSEEEGSNGSLDGDAASIDDMLDMSIEDCCDEFLGSGDDASVSGYIFDMISA